MRVVLSCLMLCVAAPEIGAAAETVSVRLSASAAGGAIDRVEISGVAPEVLKRAAARAPGDAAWREDFPVRVAGEFAEEQPAMLGRYRVEEGTLIFTPRFPLTPGVTYRIEAPGDAGKPVVREFSLPKPETAPTTVVTQVYPTGDVLPENQLKFYLHFSAPMSQGQAYRHLRLLKESGEEVDYPFLRLGEELWDREGVRFTLLFDPGRIKRGLKPREEQGPVLEEGGRYTLVIDSAWEDATGNPLKESYRKTFRVSAPDERQPDVEQWRIFPPAAGSRDPLLVLLDEPLDHAMLVRVIRVVTEDGEPLAGAASVEKQETVWKWTPDEAWKSGVYTLKISTALEDRAGNSLAKPFEVDVFRTIERKVDRETVTRSFLIESP